MLFIVKCPEKSIVLYCLSFAIIFMALFIVIRAEKTCPGEREKEECDSSNDDDSPQRFVSLVGAKRPWTKSKGIFKDNTAAGQYRCTRMFITDLGSEFVTSSEFERIKDFFYYSIKACFEDGIGQTVEIIPLFNEGNRRVCCNLLDCQQILINDFKREDFVQPYNNTDFIWRNTSFQNSRYNASDYISQIYLNMKNHTYIRPPCRDNSIVILTNRIIAMQDVVSDMKQIYIYFLDEMEYFCELLSIVVVGRTELSLNQISQEYGAITTRLFNVPSYNCLVSQLSVCMSPCGSTEEDNYAQCINRNMGKCADPEPMPTIPPPTTTTTERYAEAQHVMYIFALSKNVEIGQFRNIKRAVLKPIINNYYGENAVVVLAFIFPNTPPDREWVYDRDSALEQLEEAAHQSSTLEISDFINNQSTSTAHMMELAVQKYKRLRPNYKQESLFYPPKIILITDFVSIIFAQHWLPVGDNTDSCLGSFSYKIYALNHRVKEYYVRNHLVLDGDVDVKNASDPEMAIPINPSDEATVAPPPPTTDTMPPLPPKEKFIFITLAITLTASILILASLVFGYRRKLVRMMKLERFRIHHEKEKPCCQEGGRITDFWELSWDKLLIKSEKLGSGAYGQVYRGTIYGKPPSFEHVYQNRPNSLMFCVDTCEVAVKMLPRYASENARKEFMFEIEVMKSLGYNENIANMLGCITTGQTVCLVLEYCPHKDLLNYCKEFKEEVDLVESRDDKMAFTKDFLLFAWQISDGMRYINNKGIIHRDLAARNILIDAERNAKISDFGLCITTNNRSLPVSDASRTNSKISTSGRLPIKWLALECFQKQQFSTKTDVWSFGILLYEIYSFGGQPFEDVEPSDLQVHLEQGNRPEKTEFCPEEIYQLMRKCWLENPDERPSFQELLTLFTVFLERATEGYGYLSLLRTDTEHYAKLDKLALAREYHHNLDRRRSSLKPGSSNASVSKELCERLEQKLPKLSEDEDNLSNYSV